MALCVDRNGLSLRGSGQRWRTLAELTALAAQREGGLSYGSAGVGSGTHLAGEQLRIATGMRATHVPYRGGSTVLTDMVAGHIDFGFATVPTMIDHIRAGTVRPLAVTGSVRAQQLPEVPTMAQCGVPSVNATPLFGLVAPAGLAEAQRERLGQQASAVVREGALRAKLESLGFHPVGSTPAQFGARMEAEIDQWSRVIAAGGIKVER